MRPTTVLCCLAATLACGLAAAGPDEPAPAPPAGDAPPQYRLEAFRWSGALARDATLVARNDHGQLHVRESADGQVLVSGMIQKVGGETDEFEVVVEPADGRLGVSVRALVADPRGRVDLTLMVPSERAVELATTGEDILVREFDGPLRARSVGGDISAMRVRGLDAHTESGAISVALMGRRFDAPIVLRGARDVDVLVNEAANLNLDATGAAVAVSLPAGRLYEVTEEPGRYHARLGDGGVPLRVTSESGQVRIDPL